MGLLWNRATYGLQDVGPPAQDIDGIFGVILRLEPVLRAERLRGNEPVGRWHTIRGQVVGEFWHELVLRFPHDQDAIRAEFGFDDETLSLTEWGFGIPWLSIVRCGGVADSPAEAVARWQAAREQWWVEWRASPRPKRDLAEVRL